MPKKNVEIDPLRRIDIQYDLLALCSRKPVEWDMVDSLSWRLLADDVRQYLKSLPKVRVSTPPQETVLEVSPCIVNFDDELKSKHIYYVDTQGYDYPRHVIELEFSPL